jgi:diguanylate cyclase (GGDEF)-like protein
MTSSPPDVTAVADVAGIGVSTEQAGRSFCVMIYGEFLGRRFEVTDIPLSIGRATDAQIRLEDDSVSRAHCQIVPRADGVVIVDQQSTNGTYVNGTAVNTRILRDGDRIQVGRSIFKFLSGSNIEQTYHEEIYRLKTTDGLTGAFNKRSFDEELGREIFRFLRYRRPLSLIMFDIDHFKRVNDDFGHLAGDRVLSKLGSLFNRVSRPEDVFCRYGGEEFALLLPETGLDQACTIAEEARALVERTRFDFDDLVIPVTISAGVAQAGPLAETSDDFVAAADKRLYAAKAGGRNRVEPPPP